MKQASTAAQRPLLGLIDLAGRARQADELAVLRFMAVNDTHELAPYRQAMLWFKGAGVQSLSGVVKIEANAPFALWINQLSLYLQAEAFAIGVVDRQSLPVELAEPWSEWLPDHLLWLPFGNPDDRDGALLLARDLPWAPAEIALLAEWVSVWYHAWCALYLTTAKTGGWVRRLLGISDPRKAPRRWWQKKRYAGVLVLFLIGLLPVRLSVLAPAELVPANPSVIRSPLDGVLLTFHVQPNQYVNEGDPLFDFDEVLTRSRLEVARFALQSVEAEYRQAAQQALTDQDSKALLAMLAGRIEERRAEAEFLEEQLRRSRVTAPRAGYVLFDDPSEWVGRPVVIGERIMRVAAIDDIEIEAWLPLGDAIPLTESATVSLYLNASPLRPVRGGMRYLAHEAIERPDASYAYRMRAVIDDPLDHRVGLKGTARIDGRRVPLLCWILRRPIASVRTTLGV